MSTDCLWAGRAPAGNTFSTKLRHTIVSCIPEGAERSKTAHQRRATEWTENCPRHIGVTFAGYHVGYHNKERVFECGTCGHHFMEKDSVEADPR